MTMFAWLHRFGLADKEGKGIVPWFLFLFLVLVAYNIVGAVIHWLH